MFRWSIKRQVGLLVALGVFLLTLCMLIMAVMGSRYMTKEEETANLTNQLNAIQATIDNSAEAELFAASIVAANSQVQQAMANQDWQSLGRQFDPLWPDLKAKGIAQFQFHLPPATSLYRVHKPEKRGDDLSAFRRTVVETNQQQRSVSGLEAGVAGIGIRGVVPVKYEGQHIGSVEFGRQLEASLFVDLLADKTQLGIWQIQTNGLQEIFSGGLAQPGISQDVQQGNVRIDFGKGDRFIQLQAPLRDYMGDVIGVIVIQRDLSAINALLQSQLWMMAGFSLLGVAGLVFVVAIWLRVVLKPLKKVVENLEFLATGKGNLNQHLPEQGADEVRRLAKAFNAFVDNLRSVIHQLVARLAELDEKSVHLSQSSSETLQDMRDQQDQIHQIASAMAEMSATVREVASNTVGAAEAAKHSADQSNHGQAVVANAVSEIKQLSQGVFDASEQVQSVSNSTEDIRNVLSIIESIAEQTNLLALNAAIEAARAGESGRGFAVVADEVRSLASRTQESTQQIAETISRLQSSVGNTVSSMLDSKQKAEHSSELIVELNQALTAINQSVLTITSMNEQIATAAEEQAQVADEMTENITSVQSLSEHSYQSAENNSDVADVISNLSDELSQLAGQFHDDDQAIYELQLARSAHLNWLEKAERHLSGLKLIDPNELVDEHTCRFGKWYDSHKHSTYGESEAFKAMQEPHRKLHQSIAKLVNETVSDADQDQLMQSIKNSSRAIVQHLDQLMKDLSGNGS
ncbi:methyl-accepting chemotaxis protein [Salinibius halmophilus]|uniref:methyl-accepting chemotaxis protein n=1 Tax=Salinibius halmophilus TaxID=1853216 RepID=UPI000E6735CE|nr:methyl-accepting chemotaxis protein [Salinibius halmophilus]